MCVCVKHLHRCKTSIPLSYTSLFFHYSRGTSILRSFTSLFFLYSRGAEGTCKALPNEALCKHPRKHGLIIRVYLPGYDYLLFRVCFDSIVHVCRWEEAQPKNLKVDCIYFFTVATICFSPKPCRRWYL